MEFQEVWDLGKVDYEVLVICMVYNVLGFYKLVQELCCCLDN